MEVPVFTWDGAQTHETSDRVVINKDELDLNILLPNNDTFSSMASVLSY